MPTVSRRDAIHQLFNVLQHNLYEAGMGTLATRIDSLHHDFKDDEDHLAQRLLTSQEALEALTRKTQMLDEQIPDESLGTWIYG